MKKTVNKYNLSGEYGIGYTSKNEKFYFDLEDYEKIKNYNWYIAKDGYVKSSSPDMRMHRLVMGVDNKNMIVDHIYHNKKDNRKSQLRVVNSSQNQMNSVVRVHSSKYKGVSWHKRKNAWIVQIGINGKVKYLGITPDINKAIEIRKKAEKELFGEYAYQSGLV